VRRLGEEVLALLRDRVLPENERRRIRPPIAEMELKVGAVLVSGNVDTATAVDAVDAIAVNKLD